MNTTLLPEKPRARVLPRWQELDTVLLDMDGTLLDLRFDNDFWSELIPRRYALRHEISVERARAVLAPLFAAKQGTLEWYCTDFWTRELSLDVVGLKHEVREQVRFLPGAERFLQVLRRCRRRMVLVTNAHRDSLAVKASRTGLVRYFDRVVSSHEFGVPKEHPGFWRQLHASFEFDRARTLFVDDSPAVLRAAQEFGIGQVFAVSRPDSTLPAREVSGFPAVQAVQELLDSL